MRYLIFGTLALLLFLSQTTQAQQWELLDPDDVGSSASPTARELLDVATAYVKQKGMFESTKSPFPGDNYKGGYGPGGYDNDDDTTFERRNTSTVTYYRYNFTLTEQFGNATVNATAIVSYNPSNSNFKVTSYNYHINYQGQEAEPDHGTPGYHTRLVDTRTLTGDGDLASDVNDSFNWVIADSIEQGRIPDAKYTIQFVYGAWMQQFDGDEDVNGEGEINEGELNEEGEFNEEEVEHEEALILVEEKQTKEEEEDEVEEGIINVVEGEGEDESVPEEEEGIVDDEEQPSGPQPGYRFYEIYLKVKSSEEEYYYLNMEVNYKKENGEFVLDKSSTLGNFRDLERQVFLV